MTLILRLGSAFTDTSLPFLQKDAALPGAGGVQLFDFKNPGSYPSQSGTFSSGQQFQTLVSTNSVAQSYAEADSAGTFNASTGALTGTLDLSPVVNDPFVIDDVSHNYCFSWWFNLPTNTANNQKLAESPAGSSRSFQVLSTNLGAGLTGFNFNHWGQTSNAKTTAFSYAGGSVFRMGYAWQWSGSNWQSKSVANNGTPSAWGDISGLTDSSVGLYNTASNHPFVINFGSTSVGGAVYRLLIEDLTESGRTPEEVWDADWAVGNGRFS